MTIARTQIDGYEIELDTTGRTYGLTRPVCFIRFGKFCRHLDALSVDQHLVHAHDDTRERAVPIRIIGLIEQWARDQGYPI